MSADDRILSRRTLCRGRKFDFEVVSLRGRDGAVHERQMVRHPGAVVVLPILGAGAGGQVVFLRQRRFAVDRVLVELPAGTLEPGEEPAACAARELVEETGYRAATLTPLGRFYTSPGLSDELMLAYAALGLTHVGAAPEPDEEIEVAALPPSEVLAMMDRGELVDAKSMLTLLLARRAGMI